MYNRQRVKGLCASLALLMLTPAGAAEGASPAIRPLPPVHASRHSNFDVTHLAIALRFDWKLRQAQGSCEITLTPTSSADQIKLDGAELTIQDIALKDGTSLRYQYDGSAKDGALAITLNRVYAPGESLTLVTRYHTNWQNRSDPNNIWGSFGKGLRFLSPTTTVPTKRQQVWSMGSPESNRYWFPGYDAPNDLRTTDFTATVEKPLSVISNGELVEVRENADGTRSFHWRMDTPYPNYLTSVAVGEYVDLEQRVDPTALHTYAYVDEKAAATATAARLPDMLRFYANATGRPYPWRRYSQVIVQDFPGGMAHAMAPTITDNMIDDDRTHADFYYLWDLQESQMLAGQWFGALIAPREWKDIWLAQSFAHYFDALYNEQRNGRDEFLLFELATDQATYLSDWNSGIRHPVVTDRYDSAESFTSDNYSLVRGALVLHMLRKHLGEEKWSRVIRRYVRANANRLVTTGDFQSVVEAEAGEPMRWFFDQWLYRMGHPVFQITKAYDPAAHRLTLNVAQVQKLNPNDEYPQTEWFAGKVDIEIDGRVETVRIEAKAEQQFSFAAATAPKLVDFDYQGTWIKELQFEKSLDEVLYQFQNDRDVLARNSAMQRLIALAKDGATAAAEKDRIYSAFRAVIAGDSYWRMRLNALAQFRPLLAPGPEPALLDGPTRSLLIKMAHQDVPWLRASAIRFLGMSRDIGYTDLYLAALGDTSDRVINSAAIALGQTKDPRAFSALEKLIEKSSWKSQSLISALNGFKELGDPRAVPIAIHALANTRLPRWWLATPVWDHRLAAAETLVALKHSGDAYSMIYERFKAALAEDDYNDIFGNMQLLATLADPRGREAIKTLKEKFVTDANAMTAVVGYETQLEAALKGKH